MPPLSKVLRDEPKVNPMTFVTWAMLTPVVSDWHTKLTAVSSGAPSDAEHTGKKIKSSAATPVAVLAIDIETHGWLEHEPAERKRRRAAEGDESQQNKSALHVGSYGRTSWVQPWECEFARVVQLGWCAFGAEGRVLEAQEFSVSDASDNRAVSSGRF